MGKVKRVALELQPCCGERSGIGTYTYELAKRMCAQDDVEFCGVLFNFLGRNDNRASLDGIEMPVQINKLFPYGIYRRIWRAFPLSYDKLFPQSADLSVFFNYIVPPQIKGKVITTVYDMTYLRYPETMDKRNFRRISRDIAYSVKRSCRIVTISEFSKREIVELLGIPEEKISVVYSAPSFTEKIAAIDDVRKRFSICKPYILYVGTIEPRKNLVRLLNAFSLLKAETNLPHQLVLAGGSGWANEEIYETAKGLSCANDIIFTGYLSTEDKNSLYQHADLFVFPSLYEGFGMPPLEAMHFGCPVVCANAASLPEIVGDAAELVDPLNEHSIAGGMWRVLTDKYYAEELIQKGRAREKKFTWDASVAMFMEVCCSVLEET